MEKERLSPRVWGNLPQHTNHKKRVAPIPTCVGQPCASWLMVSSSPAYPHVCGATSTLCGIMPASARLSPRVWGNRIRIPQDRAWKTPIPTCVGQPYSADVRFGNSRAYPHVCGATRGERGFGGCLSRLSPRVWGNRLVMHDTDTWPTPIPTCVGQPLCFPPVFPLPNAYPHVCGATFFPARVGDIVVRLSPRVWGNRVDMVVSVLTKTPIPTCVGQPNAGLRGRFQPNAYPHVCGATYAPFRIRDATQRLSPRVWGNHVLSPVARRMTGLSPRVWGNPMQGLSHRLQSRPIPTCVGQPVAKL